MKWHVFNPGVIWEDKLTFQIPYQNTMFYVDMSTKYWSEVLFYFKLPRFKRWIICSYKKKNIIFYTFKLIENLMNKHHKTANKILKWTLQVTCKWISKEKLLKVKFLEIYNTCMQCLFIHFKVGIHLISRFNFFNSK